MATPLAWVSFRSDVRQPRTLKHATQVMAVCTTTNNISSHIPECARYLFRFFSKKKDSIKRIKTEFRNRSHDQNDNRDTRCSSMLHARMTLLVLQSRSLLEQHKQHAAAVMFCSFKATTPPLALGVPSAFEALQFERRRRIGTASRTSTTGASLSS